MTDFKQDTLNLSLHPNEEVNNNCSNIMEELEFPFHTSTEYHTNQKIQPNFSTQANLQFVTPSKFQQRNNVKESLSTASPVDNVFKSNKKHSNNKNKKSTCHNFELQKLQSFFKTLDNEEKCQEELEFKVKNCRNFAKKYLKLMTFLFSIIIMKRLFFDAEQNYHKIMYHVSAIAFYFLALKVHPRNIYFSRFVPLFIGVLSYYAHTRYLNYYQVGMPIELTRINRICNQVDELQNQSNFTQNEKINIQNITNPNADINDVFRHIVIFGALFINHIYIDIFLTVTHLDSLLLNLITWGLLSFYAIFNNNLTISTKISILTLAVFAFKFSYDAKDIKDYTFKSYVEQKQLNLQWMDIFKRLPIGILITRDNKVLHSNKKMKEILGKEEINNLDELDETLQINQDEISQIYLKKDVGSFRDIIDIQQRSKNYQGIKQFLGRASKIRSDNFQTPDQSQSRLGNHSSLNSSDRKFKIGQDTYSFIYQKVKVMGIQINMVLFIDQSQQEKLFAANLERKYKNIFLSSVSHSLRTPLNSLQLNNNILKQILFERPDAQELLDLDAQTHKLMSYQIDDVLDYSKLETNEFKINMKYFQFKKFMRQLCSLFENQAREKGLNFGCVFAKDVPSDIYQDEQRLGQILVNILCNAIKYTSEGYVRVFVDTIQKDNRQNLQIKIQDTGKGISADQQIGQWFSNLEVVQNVNQNGIGFGINISKRLIEQLGGEILIENNTLMRLIEPSKGVTVTIEFPYKQRLIEESLDARLDDEIYGSLHIANSQFNLLDINHASNKDLLIQSHDKEYLDVEENGIRESSVTAKISQHTPSFTKTLKQKHINNNNRIGTDQRFQSQSSNHHSRSYSHNVDQTNSKQKSIRFNLEEQKYDNLFQFQNGFHNQQLNNNQNQHLQPLIQNTNDSNRNSMLNSIHINHMNSLTLKPSLLMQSNKGNPITSDQVVNFSFMKQRIQSMNLERNQTHPDECCNKILVIDDNPFNVKSIQLMLLYCFNLTCDVAYSGKEGLNYVEERLHKLHYQNCSLVYQLILTDINMPEMDGLQMTKRIRKLLNDNHALFGSKKPICGIWAITAMNETELEDMINVDYLDGVSVKPMNHEKLGQILRDFGF